MRRTMSWSTASTISRSPLHIDPCSRQVRVGERVVEVTRKEFDLLHLRASLPETAMSRRDLMAKVRTEKRAGSRRTVDTHVGTLRTKLGDSAWIVMVRGVGYRLGEGAAS